MKIYPKSLFPNKFKTQYKSYLKWRKIVYWLIFSLNTLFLFLQFKIKMFVFQPTTDAIHTNFYDALRAKYPEG